MKRLTDFLNKIQVKKGIIIATICAVLIASLLIIYFFIHENKKISLNEKFLVQFDTRGGSIINSQNIVKGEYVIEPEKPTKSGYIFKCWQYNNENFEFDKYKVNSNIVLTANWEVEENVEIVIVHFDTDGGTQIEDIELAKGSQLIPPLNPTKDGYEFKGWYHNDEAFDLLKVINEEITLKAQWNKKEDLKNQNIIEQDNSQTTPIKDNTNNQSIIDNSQCKYTRKDGEYDGIPSWSFGIGEETVVSPYWGYWNYSADTCKITYRTDDSSILSISSSGVAVGKKIGTTNLYICVVNKATNEELDAFKWSANVEYKSGSQRAITDGKKLLNNINGFYWYLDGYNYSYIYPKVVDWYGHQALDWSSQYIDLQNNKFVVNEENSTMYYTSSNIHNEFLVNPTEFAYELISNYNMNVSNNKLYITIGGKKYSFTKSTSKKTIKPTITVDKSNISVNKNGDFNINLSMHPYSPDYKITTSSSNSEIAYCSLVNQSDNKAVLYCFAGKPGNATITITETTSGVNSKVNVLVNDVVIKVTGISLNKTSLNLLRGNTENLSAIINPHNADNKKITWSSSDTSIATVDSNGKVTAIAKGTATIIAKTSDGGLTATCSVTVNNPQLTASASIGYSTTVSNSSVSSGISVKLNAKGGSGSYTYYYIKLYNDTGLIGETSNTSSNSLFISGYKNGNYYVEYTVRDSDGNEVSGTSGITSISM